jgi:hypothetical protein
LANVRFFLLLGVVSLAACASDTDGAPFDACNVAASMNEAAFGAAVRSAPACQSDQDCVLISASVSCPEAQLGDCGRVVHRVAAQHYAQSGVNQDICEAVAGAKYACATSPSCIQLGAPRCQSGQCVATLR